MKNVAQKSLEITGLFEAELLVRLMLLNWNHPFANDPEFVADLLESASGTLREACRGVGVIEGVPARSMNLVAAVWYAEQCGVQSESAETEETIARNVWLTAVRRALPSCFCDPEDL